MKNTKLTFILIFLLACLSSKLYSQAYVGCTVGTSIPTTDFFSNYFKTGISGSVNSEYFLNNKMSVGVNFSYNFFNGNDSTNNVVYDELGKAYQILSMSRSFLSTLGNCKYYFNRDCFKPYIGIGIGYNLLTIKETFSDFNYTERDNFFTISPSIGFITGDKTKWFANLNYNYNIGQGNVIITYVNLNFGVLFQLGFIK